MTAGAIWIITSVILFLLETFTMGIFFIWFAIGALITAIAAFIWDIQIAWQLIIFISTSIITLLLTRKKIKKNLDKNSTPPVYSILGKKGLVIKEINNNKSIGQINVNGDIWSAKSQDNSIIPENSEVEILEIQGVKAIVKVLTK